ncbi:Bug family tripartite tricarboxylate transporter substrate binding protein [Zwartia sp.]|uniref:Bug family tripartite tricarboxylate transporter substrate binding protein n=1 Tax=Zwartia sp. TaxID=2978004 RepID=UPI003BB18556
MIKTAPLALTVFISAFFTLLTPSAQAAWPDDQPIKIIVPQAAGGTNDTLARMVGAELSKILGQTVVIDNRPGASGAIGMQATVQAPPDGYTIALASDSAALLDVLRPNLPWKFRSGLQGVVMIGEQPISIATSSKTSFNTLQQVIDAAKAKPGSLGYGSSGIGSSQNIVGEWMASLAGVKLVHVPYKGGGQAANDVVSGQIPLAVLGLAPMLKQQQAGNVRILAVTTLERSKALPEVPTLTELGYPQIALAQWAGLVAPAATPQPIIQKLSDALLKVLSEKSISEKMLAAGITPRPLNYQQFDAFLKKTVDTWQQVVPTLNIQIQ